MPIRITKESKTFEVEIEGSKFILQELTDFQIAGLYNKYLENGKIPKGQLIQFNLDFITISLVNWDNVLDIDTKKVIPFDSILVMRLPADVHTRLIEKILSQIDERRKQTEKELKNSKATLGKKK